MADLVHGSLSAAKLKDGREVLQLDVDAPKDATNVTVKLLELDKSVGEVTDDDLVATVTLDITAGALKVKKIDLPVTGGKKKSFRQGSVDLTVRGSDDVKRVPIVHELAENEQDIGQKQVELAIEVSATIEKKTVTYSSIAVAKTPFKTLPGGMVATFFMNSGDNYFQAAEKFWTDRCDELVMPPKGGQSLEGVRASLSRDDSDSFKNTIYEEVNLVAHGTVGFVILALAKGAKSQAVNAMHVKQFLASAPSASLRRIDPKKTRIVFRGCRIGQDPCLLRALSAAFGGARVFACNHLMSYSFPGQAGNFTAVERLIEHRGVRKPGLLKTWTDPKKRGDLASALKTAHGAWTWPKDAKDAARDPYDVVLATPETTWDGKKPLGLFFGRPHQDTFQFFVTDSDKDALKADGISRTKQALRDINAGTKPTGMSDADFNKMRYQAKILGWDPDTYDWSLTAPTALPKDKGGGFIATAVGQRVEVAARRMIALSDADPPMIDKTFDENRARTILPRLGEATHFTQSPDASVPCPISGKPGCVLD